MGEYIERQAATKFIDDCLLREEKLQSVEKETLLAVKRRIVAIPPADVRPVVRGRWTADGVGYHWVYVCSVCGWEDGYPFNERHNFCPNCGADMRGGDAE